MLMFEALHPGIKSRICRLDAGKHRPLQRTESRGRFWSSRECSRKVRRHLHRVRGEYPWSCFTGFEHIPTPHKYHQREMRLEVRLTLRRVEQQVPQAEIREIGHRKSEGVTIAAMLAIWRNL